MAGPVGLPSGPAESVCSALLPKVEFDVFISFAFTADIYKVGYYRVLYCVMVVLHVCISTSQVRVRSALEAHTRHTAAVMSLRGAGNLNYLTRNSQSVCKVQESCSRRQVDVKVRKVLPTGVRNPLFAQYNSAAHILAWRSGKYVSS